MGVKSLQLTLLMFIDVALNHKKADREKLFHLTYAHSHSQSDHLFWGTTKCKFVTYSKNNNLFIPAESYYSKGNILLSAEG